MQHTALASAARLSAFRAASSNWRRRAIEDEIELHLHRVTQLIARLDRLDSRFEDIEDDDPAGDPLDEYGEAATDTGSTLLPTPPIYGVDQSSGPLNERRAYRTWMRTQQGARGR